MQPCYFPTPVPPAGSLMSRQLAMNLEEINFYPKRHLIMFIFVVLTYGVVGGTCIYFSIADLLPHDPFTIVDTIILATVFSGYVLLFFVLFFYVIFSQFRFRFTETGIDLLTWRGRRFFPWSDVRTAWVSNSRGTIALELLYHGRGRVTVPIDAYRRSTSLMLEIARRLPIPITNAYAVPADEEING
jgi:hypothetical protein